MIDPNKRAADVAAKEKVVKRYQRRVEPDVIYPAKKQVDFYDDDAELRVAAYVRVSTDTIQQTTSYVLQKRHYEEYVAKHPKWTLVGIYADEGISGTSTARRTELNRMLTDCRSGKIDLVITKSVSRLARNVVDCITMVRNLAELSHPVGVFFESECIFSLNQDSQMPLSFLATIAEEESHIRSRSMEVSLSQRLNGGLPLTPKLLGYSHDADGNLVNVVGLIRTYGIGLIAGPVVGFIATKIKSPSKAIMGGLILSVAALVGFILFPQDPSGAVVASVLVVVFGFTTYGAFSIGSSPLSEVKIPMAIFGTASGLLSVVGFLPDVFIHTWYGGLIDAQGTQAFSAIFGFEIMFAVIGCFCLVMVLRTLKKHFASEKRVDADAETANA